MNFEKKNGDNPNDEVTGNPASSTSQLHQPAPAPLASSTDQPKSSLLQLHCQVPALPAVGRGARSQQPAAKQSADRQPRRGAS